jgi:hypothetical protein
MANTTIQLKFSTITAAPTSLNIAEPAYSYVSNTFFIGSPSGTGAIAIGGKFYIDQQQKIYDHANAAFASANNVAPQVQPAFNTANAAFIHANAAFDVANTNAGNITTIQGVNLTQNTNITTVQNTASAAFERANNSLSANNGGTIDGDVTITGNLNVVGNTVTYDVETYRINDPIILLANNSFSDILDIGFTAHYSTDSENQIHTGLVRHAATDKYYLFEGYGPHLLDDNILDVDDPSLLISTLVANVESELITIDGVNIKTFAENSFAAANAAQASANYSSAHSNAAFDAANTNTTSVTAAFNHANAAFDTANTDVTNVSITGGHFGLASQVAAFEVAANGRIVSANATSIAIAASAITSGILGVARGGTGLETITQNGVLLGQGTSAISTASSSTEGHVLTISDSGVPTFTMLSGGTF